MMITARGRLAQCALALALLPCLCWVHASPANAGPKPGFGISSVEAKVSSASAGDHADLTTRISFTGSVSGEVGLVTARVQELDITFPPGFVGNIANLPRCSTGTFVSTLGKGCGESQVGVVAVRLAELTSDIVTPVFSLKPPHRNMIARLGFVVDQVPTFADVTVRTAGDYGLTGSVHDISGASALTGAKLTLWGAPNDPAHASQREDEGNNALGNPPFMSNPTACQEEHVGFLAKSYQYPNMTLSASAPLTPTIDCEALAFGGDLAVNTTNQAAGAPTGIETRLRLVQTNAIGERATSAMKEARVTLPEGMAINSGAAAGLMACSADEARLGREVPEYCPDAAKIGSAKIVSPDIPEPIDGEIYLKSPEPGRPFQVWLISDDLGLHLKLPGDIEANPETGRVTTVFRNLPQIPVKEISLQFKGGSRGLLRNPSACGSYAVGYDLTPWSGGPDATGAASLTVRENCQRSFGPSLTAGTVRPVSATFSPFVITVTRKADEQDLASLEVTMPPGVLAKLRRVPLCGDTHVTIGDCPGGSRIGTTTVAVGAGSTPLWIPQPGKAPTAVYLAGPYRGAPYSVLFRVPAQAGPFDLGNVLVHAPIHIDPETTQVSIDAEALPQFVAGAAISYRTVHVDIDRPAFIVNPTSCRRLQVEAQAVSTGGAVADFADRFRATKCKRLRFKPHFTLVLSGNLHRRGHPKLSATVVMHRRGANIARAQVLLPRTMLLDQSHIQTICTRVQFEAGRCPSGSIYGRVRAYTPLLSKPLSGPVYLRSSDHLLPDLVADLQGQIEVALDGRIDAVHGRMRTTFEAVPDAPISRFVLVMTGGRRGLLQDSADLCSKVRPAYASFKGQNGTFLRARPRILLAGCSG
jgi:hypothetical protein